MLSLRLAVLSVAFAATGMAVAVPTSAAVPFDYSCVQPVLSKVEKEWSTPKFITDNLPNPMRPTPIFWSGVIGTKSVRTNAEQCASKVLGATIGQIMCNYNKNTSGPKFVMPSDDAPASGYALWALSSELFARYTDPTAYVVTGDARVTSIWFSTEWPTLKANTKVKKVIGIDATTCKDKCYWHCPVASDCVGLAPCSVRVTP